MRHIIRLFFVAATLFIGQARADIQPVWSTGVAVPGEQVFLYLVETQQPNSEQDVFLIKERPKVRNASVSVQQARAGANPFDPNRAMVEVLPIAIKPDRSGEIQVEDITVEYQSGRREKVAIPPLMVRPTSDIKWFSEPLAYGALWHTNIADGYVHQPVKVYVKIFMPGDCDTPYPPQMQAVGVKVGNFRQAVDGIIAQIQAQVSPNPHALAKGQNWHVADFIGEFTPFREGSSDIAGKILMVQNRGIFSIAQQELPLPMLQASALPLPPGAPDDFADTVGQYHITAKCSATTLAMNEAVEVELVVQGSGNLEQIACPKPEDEINWKLVPATRRPLIGANGETIGMIFSQLMRPTAEVGGLPAFGFSYFDPADMEYKTASTKPIPLPWRETDTAGNGQLVTSAEPPPAGTIPVQDQTDIYHFIPKEETGTSVDIPHWAWYLLYLPALSIFGWLAAQAIHRHIAAGAAHRTLEKELAAIDTTADSLAFLKAIGAFIERCVPQHQNIPELQEILRRRDEEAFRPGAQPDVSPTERHIMMKNLRRILGQVGTTLLVLICSLVPCMHADEAAKAYDERQYSRALELLEATLHEDRSNHEQATILYNIGNCQYRLGKPGSAALNYARALNLDPWFPEAKANLAFIQRKEGAILPNRTGVDTLFTLLNSRQLRLASIICSAGLALCIALLILRRGQNKPWLQASTAILVFLNLLCIIDWVYYSTRIVPDPASLPPTDLAYTLTRTTARTSADEAGGSVINLTPSTPIHLLAKRGSWSYIETFTGTRGWVPCDSIAPLKE